MVKYIEQKQQQEQQLQSSLPPELDALTLHEGGVPIIKGGGTFTMGTGVRSIISSRTVLCSA